MSSLCSAPGMCAQEPVDDELGSRSSEHIMKPNRLAQFHILMKGKGREEIPKGDLLIHSSSR